MPLLTKHSTVVCGGLRTFYLYQAEISLDKTWAAYNTFVLSIAEANIGIICACAPSLNRLFGRFFSGRSTQNRNHSDNSGSSGPRNDMNSGSVESEPHSDETAVMEENEEREMRFYGKSFYLDQVTNPSNDGAEYHAPTTGSHFRVSPHDAGNVTTVCEGPVSYGRSSADRGWPLA